MANKYWSPSSAGTTAPSAAPVAPPTPASTYSPAPTPQPTYQPEKKLGLWGKLKDFGSKALTWADKQMKSEGGTKVSNVLNAPARFFSGGIKERERQEIEKYGANITPLSYSRFNPLQKGFIKEGWESVKHPERLDPWGSGFIGKGSILEQREQKGLPVSKLDKGAAWLAEIFTPTLTDIVPVSSAVDFLKLGKKIPGVSKFTQKFLKPLAKYGDEAIDFIKKGRVGDVIETLEPGFKAPGAKKLIDESLEAASTRVNKLHKYIKGVVGKLTPAQQRIVGDLIEDSTKVLDQVDEPLRIAAQKLNDIADDIGREGVELYEMTKGKVGLNPESFNDLKGKYLPHIWNELVKVGDEDFISKAPSSLLNFWKKRKGKLGYIKEAGPAAFKGLATQITANEVARGYIEIAKKFGIKLDDAKKILVKEGPEALESFGYLPKDLKDLGMNVLFKDVKLPPEVVSLIRGITPKAKAVTNLDKAWQAGLKVHDKAMNAWKLGKTIYNPAYHVRNIISNQILANMATGRGIPLTIVDSFRNLVTYLGKGSQKYVNAAEDISLIRKASLVDNYKILMEQADLVQKGAIEKFGDLWKGLQNHSEDIAKLSVFKNSIDDVVAAGSRSLDEVLLDPQVVKTAKDLAEEAIFSPYRIGAGERALMSRIVPFYSFSRQVIPFTIKTAVTHPERIAQFQKAKYATEALSDDVVQEEDRPDWQKGSIQLPFDSKPLDPKAGEPIALDTSYLYPWGNLTEGPGASVKKGQLPGGLSLNPFIMEGGQQLFNKDLYFDQDIQTSKLPGFSLKDMTSTKPRRAMSQRFAHIASTVLPSAYRTYFGKLKPAIEGVPDYAGRDRELWMAVFDAFGLKTTVLRPDDKKMFDIIDQRKELKEIKSQMYSVAADQRLDDVEKQELLNDYVKEIEKLFQ